MVEGDDRQQDVGIGEGKVWLGGNRCKRTKTLVNARRKFEMWTERMSGRPVGSDPYLYMLKQCSATSAGSWVCFRLFYHDSLRIRNDPKLTIPESPSNNMVTGRQAGSFGSRCRCG